MPETIFDKAPRPNQMMNSGTKATRGRRVHRVEIGIDHGFQQRPGMQHQRGQQRQDAAQHEGRQRGRQRIGDGVQDAAAENSPSIIGRNTEGWPMNAAGIRSSRASASHPPTVTSKTTRPAKTRVRCRPPRCVRSLSDGPVTSGGGVTTLVPPRVPARARAARTTRGIHASPASCWRNAGAAGYRHVGDDPAGARRHHDHPIRQCHGLGEIVADQHDGAVHALPQFQAGPGSSSLVCASSAPNGSSRKICALSSEKVRARATRWRMPWESWRG